MDPDPQVAALRHSSRELVRQLGLTREIYGASGLTATRCEALLEIERRGTIGVLELAAVLRLDKAAASRLAHDMMSEKLIAVGGDPGDRRRRVLSLTAKGKRRLERVHADANEKAEKALAVLRPEDREAVLRGLALYTHALERVRLRERYAIRPIERRDNPAIAAVIRTVAAEYGASGAGFTVTDPEVNAMYEAYQQPGSAYWVVASGGEIAGGGGFAPLRGATATCELRKMYFLPQIRGLGFGRELLDRAIDEARRSGYRAMVLETMDRMREARRLYESRGFRSTPKPADTGHFGCDAWYRLSLKS